jgi:hypothetical protein
MPSYRLRRSVPVLILILLAGLILPLTPASAFPLPSAVTLHSSRSLGSSVWAWLAHLFHATGEKNGMAIDPNGQPAANGDTGSQPDPHG